MDDWRELARSLRADHSIREIAAIVGQHTRLVHDVVRDLPFDPMTGMRRRTSWRATALHLARQGVSDEEIARLVGRTRGTVQLVTREARPSRDPYPAWYPEALKLREQGMGFERIAEAVDRSPERVRKIFRRERRREAALEQDQSNLSEAA